MKSLKATMTAAVLTLAGAAGAQDMPAPTADELAWDMSRTCRAFTAAGTDAESCRVALRAAVDGVAGLMAQELAHATAPVQFGAVDGNGMAQYMVNPAQIMPGAQSHADQVGTGYKSKIDGACAPLRALPDSTAMAETILAANECLMTAGVLAKAAGRDTATIQGMGENLTQVARQARRLGL